jgi:tRNA nucleotidyltransferase (CCA-adding enzyme)
MVTACEADFRGRAGYEGRPYPQGERLRRIFAAAAGLDMRQILARASGPEQIPLRIREARVAAVRTALGMTAEDPGA